MRADLPTAGALAVVAWMAGRTILHHGAGGGNREAAHLAWAVRSVMSLLTVLRRGRAGSYERVSSGAPQ